MVWARAIAGIAGAYLLGSIPVGYLLVKLFRRLDIRRIGSGHTGGTNVLRVAGVLPAILTVLSDCAKGYAGVALARAIAPEWPMVAALGGLAVVAGHDWPVSLGFRGGVGTMTTGGAAVALVFPAAAVAAACGCAVVAIWRYSSLGSLTFAFLLSLATLVGVIMRLWPATTLLFALGTSAMAVWHLRANIVRLRQGTERQVGQPVPPEAGDVSRHQPPQGA